MKESKKTALDELKDFATKTYGNNHTGIPLTFASVIELGERLEALEAKQQPKATPVWDRLINESITAARAGKPLKEIAVSYSDFARLLKETPLVHATNGVFEGVNMNSPTGKAFVYPAVDVKDDPEPKLETSDIELPDYRRSYVTSLALSGLISEKQREEILSYLPAKKEAK